MFRLETDMRASIDEGKLDPAPGGIRARYNWDRDLIIVYVDTIILLRNDGTLNFQRRQEWTDMATGFVRYLKQQFEDYGGKRAADHFIHDGFQRKGPDGRQVVLSSEEIAGRILIRVEGFAITSEDPIAGVEMFVESRLLEESITVGENHTK
ncbi:MAG: hypothetical protein IH621_05855 [Krumholzibacteria bacterium]|nr:hypothetical protein [Candidatus Krumholzibacteria bacterium]